MNTTNNFELQVYEADDIVNVMTVDKSNMEKIDEVMKANQLSGIGTATENKSGTVHALTRANSDVDVFRFTATSNFTAGDTFVVDTVQVTALLPSGESLGTGAYVIGSEVLCSLRDTLLTVYVTSGVVAVATDSEKLGGNLPEYYGTASDVAQAQATANAAGVLAQSNTQLISGLDTRVEALENQGQIYNIGVEEAIGVMGVNTVYRKRYFAENVTISGTSIIDSSINSSTHTILSITGVVEEDDRNVDSLSRYFATGELRARVHNGLVIEVSGKTVKRYYIELVYFKK